MEAICQVKTEELTAKLKKEENKCIETIINYISDEQLEYIKDKTFLKDIFDTQMTVFERKTISSQLFIRKKLLLLK